MSSLNILSGGAAQGLVASLAAAFKAQTGFDIAGEFGAVGAMADKLRKGTPTDIVILTAALIAKLARGKARRRRLDHGCRPGRDRACRPRRRSHGRRSTDAAELARGVSGGGRDLRAGHQGLDRRHSRREGSGAARHRRRGRGPAEDLSERRDRDAPSGGSPMRGGRSAARSRPRSSHQRRGAVRLAAAGMRPRDHVHGGGHDSRPLTARRRKP